MKFETVVACVGQKRDPTYRSPTLRRRRREETWPPWSLLRGGMNTAHKRGHIPTNSSTYLET